MFSAYNLMLPPEINQLMQLIVFKIYKVNSCLQMFQKNTINKINNSLIK